MTPTETRPAERAAARSYLSDFLASAQRALEAAGDDHVHDLTIGAARVRLRFAGDALRSLLLPALSHRQVAVSAEPADLEVDLWDTESTGVVPPRFPWHGGDIRERGAVRGYNVDGVRTAFHGDLMRPADDFRALSMLDSRIGEGGFWVLGADRVPWYERAAPLRTLLHWGLRKPDRLLVHAGAIGIDGRGALLCGAAGSGKSTSAVACLLAGLDYVGDDYVLLELDGARPRAHSIYATAKVPSQALELLDELDVPNEEREGVEEGKVVLDIRAISPQRLTDRLPIEAIVLPRLGSAETGLRPASGAAALRALAPSTIYQAPYDGGAAMKPLTELVRAVPSYVLELGGPPSQVPPLLAELIEGLPAA